MSITIDWTEYLRTGCWTREQAYSLTKFMQHIADLEAGDKAPADAPYIVVSTNAVLTNERVLTAGTGINASDGGAGSTFTLSVTLAPFSTDDLAEGSNLYFTDERVDDRVGNLLVAGANISLTYDDGADTLTIASTSGGSVTSVDIANATGISFSGGPITTSGTFTPALSANLQAWHALATSEKQDTITGAATTITSSDLTADRALISDGSGKVAVSDVTATELGYLDGATSNIQGQIDALGGTFVITDEFGDFIGEENHRPIGATA